MKKITFIGIKYMSGYSSFCLKGRKCLSPPKKCGKTFFQVTLPIILCSFFLFGSNLNAQLKTYNYPGSRTNDTKNIISDQYRVWVKIGNNAEQELDVLWSEGNKRSLTGGMPSNIEADIKSRSFSLAHVSYNNNGSSLTFRVKRIYSANINSVTIHPESYNVNGNVNSAKDEVTFTVNGNNKYITVNFNGTDNETANFSWLKNMLVIAIDPLETDLPSGNIVDYSNSTPSSDLENADVIRFTQGYHNIFDYNNKSTGNHEEGFITHNGGIRLKNGQEVYIEGGAFVEGYIFNDNYGDENQKVYGRGVISLRQYTWHHAGDFNIDGTNSTYLSYWKLPVANAEEKLQEFRPSNVIALGLNATVTGIIAFNPSHHGIISREGAHMENIKFVGWHHNNDGFRPNGGIVKNCFLRACDDHFYSRDIDVSDCVIWPAHNGSIMTSGWGPFDIGNSSMTNIDILFAEWRGNAEDRSTNEGLYMSRNDYNFEPTGMTYFKDIRFEGSIPRFISVHTGSSPEQDSRVELKEGYLGEASFENISIEKQLYTNLLIGDNNADAPNGGTFVFKVKNMSFKDVIINGTCLTNSNKNQFFTMENTENISFQGCQVNYNSIPGKIEAEDFSEQHGIQTESCSEGGLNVGWIASGDWMEYNVDVASAGEYTVDFRVASNSSSISFDLKNGSNVLTSVNSSSSGGWQSWKTVTQTISLSAGEQTLRVQATSGGWNINWINFSAQEEACPLPGEASVSKTDASCGGSDGSITFSFNDTDGRTGIKFSIDGGNNYTNVGDNTGSYTFAGLTEGTYHCWVAWGNGDCPTSLGNITISCSQGVEPGIFFLYNNETGFKMRPVAAEGHAVSQASGGTGSWVQWEIIPTSGAYFYLKNMGSSQYLSMPTTNNHDIIYTSQSAGLLEEWKKVDKGGGYYLLENRETGKRIRATDYLSSESVGEDYYIHVSPQDWEGSWVQWRFENANPLKSTQITNSNKNTDPTIIFYPNPAKKVLHLKGLTENDIINIYDIQGHHHLKSKNQPIIDISFLKRGLYILQVNEGKISKFFKE